MGAFKSIGRYAHTLRHLRLHQIYGRFLFDRVVAQPDVGPAPALRLVNGVWSPPAARRQSLIGPTTLRLLNQDHDLDAIGWGGGDVDLLWRFNQHYFEDLNALGSGGRMQWHLPLMQRWVRDNPPARGVGWRPYPNSLRIVNWIKWSLGGGALPAECIQSLATQARWQRKRIEWHYLGNHLLVNAKALVFAGCFFAGDEADEWRREGLRIYAQQLPEQVLADGGHYELSPMYQSLILEDLLDLVNLASAFPRLANEFPQAIRDSIMPMRRWLAAMCHPDGQISFFNDAAFGIAPVPVALAEYAGRLGFAQDVGPADGFTHLAASGFVRLQLGAAVVIADVGDIGAAVCPAHVHADTLSFEMSLHGKRVLVNTGVSLYGQGALREMQRGTASHNTVTIDSGNSSDVWGGFRVARRARVHGVSLNHDPCGALEVRASHDGYRFLAGRPVHERRWWLGQSELRIADRVSARRRALAHYHFAPGALDECDRDPELSDCRMSLLGGRARFASKSCASAGPYDWCPEFGRAVPSTRMDVQLASGEADVRVSWGSSLAGTLMV